MIPYELLQDLNKLVCVSGNKKIENLFVKLSLENVETFSSWIAKNKNNRNLISAIGGKDVLNALAYLYENMYNEPAEGWRAFMINENPSYMAVYGPLFRLLSEGKHQEILSPLTNVLSKFSSVRQNDFLPDGKVDSDLNKIYREYSYFASIKQNEHPKKGLSQREKDRLNKVRLFNLVHSYLIKDITGASSEYPSSKNVVGVIKSSGLLDIGQVYNSLRGVPTPSFMRESSKITNDLVRDVIRDGKDGNLLQAYYSLKLNMFQKLEFLYKIEVERARSNFFTERMKKDKSSKFSLDNLLPHDENEDPSYEEFESFDSNKVFKSHNLVDNNFVVLASMIVNKMAQVIQINPSEIKVT